MKYTKHDEGFTFKTTKKQLQFLLQWIKNEFEYMSHQEKLKIELNRNISKNFDIHTSLIEN